MAIRHSKDRVIYGAATLAVIALGLASRIRPGIFPAVLDKYPGDALWALMVFFALRALKPAGSIAVAAVLALCVSWLDEISQLYQAPWINAIRANPFGHLLLGYSFSPVDMVAYAMGIGIGVLVAVGMRAGKH